MKKISVFLFALTLLGTGAFAAPSVEKPSRVQLTVYNQNFALIKEVRGLTLDKGINFVSVPDVAATIQPDTVAIKSLLSPNAFVVREQNYQYDLINPATILNKSIGKRVLVRRFNGGTFQVAEGTLLSSEGGVVIQTADGVLLNPSGEIQVLELPGGLVSRPTLVWKLESAKSGAGRAEISYLANQITWKADYVAVIDAKDERVDITGWVTLSNNSGATYENASLNLMAGDVNRISGNRYRDGAVGAVFSSASMKAEPQFAEKSLFEYHLYTLKDKTTVKNRETKQISLLAASDVPVQKQFIYDGRKGWWGPWRIASYRPGESYDASTNKKVNVFVEFMNSKQNNLGMPLPKGIVRVYKSEEGSNQHFIGEDSIDHTPKDEKIRLYLGDAFDIVGEHARINFRRIDTRTVEETFRITLRNHKDSPVTVTAIEHLVSDWSITQSSHKYYKKDASTVEIPVTIPKDGEVQITYTARTHW